jgi:hypothetical protein
MRNAGHIALIIIALLLSSVVASAQAPTGTVPQSAIAPSNLSAAPTDTSAASIKSRASNSGQLALAPTTSASALIAAANQTKASNEVLLKAQEVEIATATVKLEELRKLVADGLVARVELENAESLLAGLRTNLETAKNNISASERTIADLRKAEEMARAKPLVPVAPSSTRSFLTPTILRYSGQGSWSLGQLITVQSFFASTFGYALPTSAVGQSTTHNRLGYDHRNAVDVALHPDSVQGKALISYLQSQRIPFLAFRAAIAGVATGPHIHIGSPSHRLS